MLPKEYPVAIKKIFELQFFNEDIFLWILFTKIKIWTTKWFMNYYNLRIKENKIIIPYIMI